jgi:peptidoglycan L-alanyl-D-glutamate endopeptidase CwlK
VAEHEAQMTDRDARRLRGVHPQLAEKIATLLDDMAAAGFPMFVAQGVRTTLQQQALYAQGRTVKGLRVTNADGVVKKSNHQPKADGFGHAVDLAFVGPVPFADEHPWELMVQRAEALGLKWGGRWTSLPDRPHVELPAPTRSPVGETQLA